MPLDTEKYNNNNLSNYFIPTVDFQMMPNQITIDETIKTFEPRLRGGPIESNEKEGVSALLMMMNAPPPAMPITMIAKAEKNETEKSPRSNTSDSEGDHSEHPHYIYLGTSGPGDMIDEYWEGKFQELLDFIKENPYHDHLRKARVVNKELYHWIESQRNAYKDGRLAPAKIDRLNTVEFPWKNRKGRQSISNKRIPELRGFFERYGHWDVPKEKYPELFSWVTNQRWFKKKGTISKDTERQLNEIGFDWRIKNSRKKSEEEEVPNKRKESPVHESVADDFMKRYRRRLDEFSEYSPYNNRDM